MAKPAILNLTDALARRMPEPRKKYPVMTAGGLGIAFTAPYAITEGAQKTEGNIMKELSGGSSSKYAAQNAYLNFLKTAVWGDMVSTGTDSLIKGVGTGMGAAGVDLLKNMIVGGASAIKGSTIDEAQRTKIFKLTMEKDMDLKSFERINPGVLLNAFKGMARVAPKLSMEPLVVMSFLRHVAITRGAVDYMSIKALSEAELAYGKSSSSNHRILGGR